MTDLAERDRTLQELVEAVMKRDAYKGILGKLEENKLPTKTCKERIKEADKLIALRAKTLREKEGE